MLLHICRSWGIGTGQSDGQRKSFEAVLKRLNGPLAQLGGPFLTGKEVSLVSACRQLK